MIWKDITGYGCPYRINEEGDVWRFDRAQKKWMRCKPLVRKRTVVFLRLKDGRQKQVGVTRLMDRAFFNGYGEKNGLSAYHKDGSKANCSRDNLLWMTQSEIGKIHGGRGRRKPVIEYDRQGKEVAIYKSITAAGKAHNVGRVAMANRISGRVLDPSGHFFRLEEN